ncbi:hypothetical protein ANCCEY_05466 [Ancylostoma ceylanicum]|uniref:DM13 domain-containing protein n=1 Tax=Ancylostoma ceylanicum TaxID=53326 RepID=A0A0D6LTN2_9BILA|nr:hypothetical protein ANCCEY_05466 [Ancylostoma ceylanicum]
MTLPLQVCTCKSPETVQSIMLTELIHPVITGRVYHCSIKEDWTNEDIVVRLADGQTVYDIEWVSVFCYNYSVDFAHLPVK